MGSHARGLPSAVPNLFSTQASLWRRPPYHACVIPSLAQGRTLWDVSSIYCTLCWSSVLPAGAAVTRRMPAGRVRTNRHAAGLDRLLLETTHTPAAAAAHGTLNSQDTVRSTLRYGLRSGIKTRPDKTCTVHFDCGCWTLGDSRDYAAAPRSMSSSTSGLARACIMRLCATATSAKSSYRPL